MLHRRWVNDTTKLVLTHSFAASLFGTDFRSCSAVRLLPVYCTGDSPGSGVSLSLERTPTRVLACAAKDGVRRPAGLDAKGK
ncbi:hypothetical protein K431DRAFT_288987 [Polychaeton citri CBS 116435]|uniref:Uncharacterized protein n=1 Tax=Polychaeton citri CBS 116435 TaxID=1314669 RepID=A0A9P4Q1T4_9PEZI|nr:hypothetical protein K431DRAFT_288987 [Polychaeton citri CBS 116435]